MVAPVLGPYVKTVGGTGSPVYYSYKSGYKQTAPHTIATAYTRRVGFVREKVVNGALSSWHARDIAFSMNPAYLTNVAWLHARNYDRLKNRMSDRASLGVSLAEVGVSTRMIQQRLLQISRFVRRLKKFDFQGAASALSMPGPPKRVSTKRKFADNYLEFHFGWAPLVGDIFSAVDVLQSPLNAFKIRVRSQTDEQTYHLSAPIHTTSSNIYPNYVRYDAERTVRGKVFASMGVEVAVSNPNLWLANQLGLVNPLLIAYELVPFSFVANWFVNVEQFLSSGTDFLGLTLQNAWTNVTMKGNFEHYLRRWYKYTVNGGVYYQSGETRGPGTYSVRTLGLTGPSLQVRPWKNWHWRRTASAAALLVQQFGGR